MPDLSDSSGWRGPGNSDSGRPLLLIGCDFSSRPQRRKPIVIARGYLRGPDTVVLGALETVDSLDTFSQWLVREPQWVGGFDFPFGLPRLLVQDLGWPTDWADNIRHYASLSRADIRDQFAAFCARRPPVGGKFAHRATDRWAGSSPSMKWVNPPVAYMLHAGVPALIDAGVCLPGLHAGDPGDVDARGRSRRVALEAYPGLVAREVLGRASYKSDDPSRQTVQRLGQRQRLLDAVEGGGTRLGLRLSVTQDQRAMLLDDGSGDRLDAALCLLQAAWGVRRGWPDFGLPMPIDPLEGWIVTAIPQSASDAPA